MDKINKILTILKNNSLLKKKKTCFLIGTTKKKSSYRYYLTPFRESQKTFYAGAVVYDNNTAKSKQTNHQFKRILDEHNLFCFCIYIYPKKEKT